MKSRDGVACSAAARDEGQEVSAGRVFAKRLDAPADVGAHAEGTASHCEERAFAARGAAWGHVAVVRVRRPAEDVVERLAPLSDVHTRISDTVRDWLAMQQLTWSVCGTFVRTKGTAPQS